MRCVLVRFVMVLHVRQNTTCKYRHVLTMKVYTSALIYVSNIELTYKERLLDIAVYKTS